MTIGVTTADMKNLGEIEDACKKINRSVRDGEIVTRHSIKKMKGMGSRSHDLGADLRMLYVKVDCVATKKEKVAVVVPVTSVGAEVTIRCQCLP